jgi:uncharacterized protein YjbJ (UPF0337 family)
MRFLAFRLHCIVWRVRPGAIVFDLIAFPSLPHERTTVMVNQQMLQGAWNEIAGKIRSKWGQLSDDELNQFEGNTAQLVGFIQRKTGESRDKIEKFLNDVTANSGATISQFAETARDYATQAVQSARESAESVARRARDSYATAEKMVTDRPAASVAAAFGAGLITGVVLALLMRTRD